MFTDLVGFTRLGQRDEALAMALRREHQELVRPLFAAHGGREVKSLGDGFLVEFSSAVESVQCAVDIQTAVARRNNRPDAKEKIAVRIGIHLGDVIRDGSDIVGDAVNVASRLEPLAEPGGICVSASVFEQVRNKVAVSIEKVGSRTLKNVELPVEIFRVTAPVAASEPPTPETGPKRLAVLPFVNFSPDANDAYFADGLTEELITLLSQLSEIRVIARTSVFRYKSTAKSISQIGSELGVSSIIEGSVRKSRDRVRITVQLVDARTEEHLWASTYDRTLDDIFFVQSEVAKRIAKALKINLKKLEESRLEALPKLASESYLEYLKGRALLTELFAERTFRSALERFRAAISIDPRNARAHAGLADAMLELIWGRYETEEKANLDLVRIHSTRAMDLDPNLAESHCSLANLQWHELEFASAEKEFERAVALNPSYAFAHLQYGYLLREEGRPEEAYREYTIAEALDPQSVRTLEQITEFLCQTRRLDEAKTRIDRMEQLAPGSSAHHVVLAWYDFARSEYRHSLDEVRKARATDPEPWTDSSVEAWAYALLGEREKAKELLREAESGGKAGLYSNPSIIAIGYALAGDLDAAFRVMFDALERTNNVSLAVIRLEPTLEKFRADPRFRKLLDRMNLP